MKRGEVRWYEFQPPDKRRPVLVLTRDSAIPVLREITVAPITSTIRGIPSEVILGTDDGMPQPCAANLDHLQTVPKHKIGRLIASLSSDKLRQIGPALSFALGLDEFLRRDM
jgi:mRNA interferase MazF